MLTDTDQAPATAARLIDAARSIAAQLDGERPIQRTLINEAMTEAFGRSEEHTSELQSLMRISYAVFCLKKKNKKKTTKTHARNVAVLITHVKQTIKKNTAV